MEAHFRQLKTKTPHDDLMIRCHIVYRTANIFYRCGPPSVPNVHAY